MWWKCSKAPDHEWRTSIHNRAVRGKSCPFCAGYRLSSTNCLDRVHPGVAKTWHPTKNALTPRDVRPGSARLAWWICPVAPDHVWRAPIGNRIRHGCPFCAGRKLCPSNSLAEAAPDVSAQWHPRKNGKLRPTDVYYRSGRIVWWKCNRAADHEWRTAIVNRQRMGPGCPFCSGRWVAPSDSLADRLPALAAQWHRMKNGRLRARDVHPGTRRVVWWKCAAGPDHDWQNAVVLRARSPRCPFCAGLRVSVTNSLAALYPKIASQWHTRRNRALHPREVVATARQSFWWRCPLGHDWRAAVRDRTVSNRPCPTCTRTAQPSRTAYGSGAGRANGRDQVR